MSHQNVTKVTVIRVAENYVNPLDGYPGFIRFFQRIDYPMDLQFSSLTDIQRISDRMFYTGFVFTLSNEEFKNNRKIKNCMVGNLFFYIYIINIVDKTMTKFLFDQFQY